MCVYWGGELGIETYFSWEIDRWNFVTNIGPSGVCVLLMVVAEEQSGHYLCRFFLLLFFCATYFLFCYGFEILQGIFNHKK